MAVLKHDGKCVWYNYLHRCMKHAVPPCKVRALLQSSGAFSLAADPQQQQATSSSVWFHGDRERGNTTDARTLSLHSSKSLFSVNNWQFLQDSVTKLG